MTGHGRHLTNAETHLNLSFRRSRLLIGWYAVLYLASLCAVLLLEIPLWVQLLFAVATGVLCFEGIRRQAVRTSPGAVLQLQWQADSRWRIETVDGRVIRPNRWRVNLVHRWLVILLFWCGESGRAITVFVPADAIDNNAHRTLRARLKSAQSEPDCGR